MIMMACMLSGVFCHVVIVGFGWSDGCSVHRRVGRSVCLSMIRMRCYAYAVGSVLVESFSLTFGIPSSLVVDYLLMVTPLL